MWKDALSATREGTPPPPIPSLFGDLHTHTELIMHVKRESMTDRKDIRTVPSSGLHHKHFTKDKVLLEKDATNGAQADTRCMETRYCLQKQRCSFKRAIQPVAYITTRFWCCCSVWNRETCTASAILIQRQCEVVPKPSSCMLHKQGWRIWEGRMGGMKCFKKQQRIMKGGNLEKLEQQIYRFKTTVLSGAYSSLFSMQGRASTLLCWGRVAQWMIALA